MLGPYSLFRSRAPSECHESKCPPPGSRLKAPQAGHAVSGETRYDESPTMKAMENREPVTTAPAPFPRHPPASLLCGLPEYRIAGSGDETLAVLVFEGKGYVEHGVFGRGGSATSPLPEGFAAAVSAMFDAPEPGADGAGP